MKRFIFNTVAFAILIVAALFDQDGAQVGVAFYNNEALNAVAHFFGNLLWIVGLVYLLVAGGLFVAATDPLSDKWKGIREATLDNKGQATARVLHWVSIGITVLLVGSGFWFTGIARAVCHLADWFFVESHNTDLAKRKRNAEAA
jgi:hypothetical protein